MKLTKSYLKQIISEELLLSEGRVRISSDIDAEFRPGMVQLVSRTGRLPIDKKSMRVLLALVKQHLPSTGYASMMRKKGINTEAIEEIRRLFEAKRFSLPNGVKVDFPASVGRDPFIIYGFGTNKVTMKKDEMVNFLRAIQKHAGIR